MISSLGGIVLSLFKILKTQDWGNFLRVRRKGVDANIVALHSNTSVQMINQHYQDMSDDHLLEIHNKVFPSRTKNPNYKVITKKS